MLLLGEKVSDFGLLRTLLTCSTDSPLSSTAENTLVKEFTKKACTQLFHTSNSQLVYLLFGTAVDFWLVPSLYPAPEPIPTLQPISEFKTHSCCDFNITGQGYANFAWQVLLCNIDCVLFVVVADILAYLDCLRRPHVQPIKYVSRKSQNNVFARRNPT